jgi:hypothetical protein
LEDYVALVDLDAELVRVRDPRSKVYFGDALRAYRAGAFRAATAAAWVAIAYDLLRKYRELDGLGDKEASAYLKIWDQAVQSNDIGKLLELERNLLDHAHTKMGIVDAMGLRALKRLYEDRHLCAHPAFASQEELYEPTAELVRTHLHAAVELVLAQRPVQGKGIFEAFSADVQSPGFPSLEPTIVDYVEQKYLSNMRESVLRNFGVILGKSLVQNVPTDWHAFHNKVKGALRALKERRPLAWDEVATGIIKLINDDDPNHRLRCVALLAAFPEFVARLNPATMTALESCLLNDAAVVAAPTTFSAVEIEAFKARLQARFASLDDESAAGILSVVAPPSLWASALARYARSSSFRGAEARFVQFVLPFQSLMQDQHLTELFAVIEDNGQIWDAGATPGQVARLIAAIPRRPSDDAVNGLYWTISARVRAAFEETWRTLEGRGWTRPAARPHLDDNDPFL